MLLRVILWGVRGYPVGAGVRVAAGYPVGAGLSCGACGCAGVRVCVYACGVILWGVRGYPVGAGLSCGRVRVCEYTRVFILWARLKFGTFQSTPFFVRRFSHYESFVVLRYVRITVLKRGCAWCGVGVVWCAGVWGVPCWGVMVGRLQIQRPPTW